MTVREPRSALVRQAATPMATIPSQLEQALSSANKLCPMPHVATRLFAACDSPDVSALELAEIIATDPVVALRLLVVANSSLYGFSGKVASIEHAIVLLGRRTVRDLCISIASAAVFPDAIQSRSGVSLWNHSLACGSIACHLAQQSDCSEPQEAFLAGVLHDVGKILLYKVLPGYSEFLSAKDSCCVVEETSEFGISHTSAGEACARSWGLPLSLVNTIADHHCEPDDINHLAGVVSAANRLSRIWIDQPDSDQLPALDIGEDALDQLRQNALADYEAILGAVEG